MHPEDSSFFLDGKRCDLVTVWFDEERLGVARESRQVILVREG